MARKARGPNATSAKVDPQKGRTGKRTKKMGLAEEVRSMLPTAEKVDKRERPLENGLGRKVSGAGLVTLAEGAESEDDMDGDYELVENDESEADDADLVPEDDLDLSGDELDNDDESAEFSDSSEGSEAAEIEVAQLQSIEDVDALEQTDLDAITMPSGDALARLQAELAGDSDSDASESSFGAQANDTLDVATEEENDDVDEVALSEIGSDVDADAADIVPKARETVNNTAALQAAYKRIALALPKQFSQHHTLFTDEPVVVADVDDDLNRELVFYKQALTHARIARSLIKKEGAAWERPADYFAEMVKTDDHMERIRKEQVAEATGKKASAEAKKQRELKKFGKQVQISKTLEREKEKKAMTDKVKSLKRKRGAELEGKEDFDVALDEAVAAPSKTAKRGGNASREARDKKYGHGGSKRYAKSNDALSSGDVTGFSSRAGRGGRGGRGGARGGRGGRGGAKRGGAIRPGKSKRH